MTQRCVPTLSTDGWVTDPVIMFDRAFADFMTSNYSQSNEFYGAIASLPWVIQKTTGDRTALKNVSKRVLEDHLADLFDIVQVDSEVRDHPTDKGRLQLIFYVQGVVDSVPYNFVKGIENIDSKTLQLFELNNG